MTEWLPHIFLGMGLVMGWLSGALWGTRRNLADIRSHQLWLENYTTSVNELLSDFVNADEPASPIQTEGE